jgi:ribosome-binding protein aMBF1 (putative translation factor)
MAVLDPCDNCGRETPIYRLAAVILDGHVARICPQCASSEKARIEMPYAPRADQGAIQPSTSREVW